MACFLDLDEHDTNLVILVSTLLLSAHNSNLQILKITQVFFSGPVIRDVETEKKAPW